MNRYTFWMLVGLFVVAVVGVAAVAYLLGTAAASPAPAVDVAGRIAARQAATADSASGAPWLLIAAILLIVALVAGALFLRQYAEAQRQRRLSQRQPRPYSNGYGPGTGLPQLPAPREGDHDA